MPASDTPAGSGFRMPAEWEPHEATWLAWPHNRNDWPGKFATIQWVYVEIVRHLHRRELIRIVVEDAKQEQRARRALARAGVDFGRVEFYRFRTDRSWIRDNGPIFVKGGPEVAATCWRFNAWARYSNWKHDAALNRKITQTLGMKTWRPRLGNRPVVLEGGAIDVNGRSTLLTSEECLLGERQQRNPGMTQQDYESVFADYLGIHKTLWLGQGIAGDDTGGHIDDLARFVGPRRVAAVVEANRNDVNYEPLRRNLESLRSMTDQEGRRLEVVELPMPRPLHFGRYRLPASYANFYVANGLVLVPTFNDPNDRIALDTLQSLFPEREVVGIHSVDFVWGFGTIHCATQQQPAS